MMSKYNRYKKISDVKSSVIKSLKGVPLLHLADILHKHNGMVNEQETVEICPDDTHDRSGDKNALTTKRKAQGYRS